MSYGAANYGRNVLLRPSAHYHGGMAMPDVNPRGGVFGPQGYGGGIFSGVGQMTTTDVRSWQGLLNVELRNRSMNVIPVTGKVDAATCGATLALVNAYNAGEPVYGALADAFEAGAGLEIATMCEQVPQPWPTPKQQLGTMKVIALGVVSVIGVMAASRLLKRRR